MGCKAGVWQVGLIDGCSVAVSIQTPAPSTPSRIVVDQRRSRAAGDGLRTPFDLPVQCDPLTDAEPAVMHVISADTKVVDTIRYDTPIIGSDTIPIR